MPALPPLPAGRGRPRRAALRAAGFATALALLLAAPPAAAQQAGVDLTELSLEDLMQIEVTVSSFAKKDQQVRDVPAAVFVITAEDIRRAGVDSIPEALRLAPGVHVARINQSTWSITARGFGSRFANKLLVMIDGRTLYSTSFSGVFWDVQDVVLEDVERIEVIRGPGASIWGANAVNGVINIITKSAAETQGTLLSTRVGSEARPSLTLRHGDTLGEDGFWRVYAKGFERDGLGDVDGGDGEDDQQQRRGGFRMDFAEGDGSFTLQGDVYAGRVDVPGSFPVLAPFPAPASEELLDEQRVSGGNLVAHWSRETGPDSSWDLRVIADRAERDSLLFDDVRDTFEVDFHRRWAPREGHDVVWGLGWRGTRSDTEGGSGVRFGDEHDFDQIFSAFVQDEITLVPDRLALTLGTKLEHNDYTGLELQPTARALWTPDEDTTWWGAVSRAVRTPSQVDAEGQVLLEVVPGMPPGFNTGVVLNGDEDFDSEVLDAFELGYRRQFGPGLSVDVAAFVNRYEGLATVEEGATSFVAPGVLLTEASFDNQLDATTRGVELALSWQPLESVDLRAAFTRLSVDHDLQSGSSNLGGEPDDGSDPEDILHLGAHWAFAPGWELDGNVFHVDDIPALEVPGYWRADLRLGFHPDERSEWSLGVQNLLHNDEVESAPTYLGGQAEMETGVYLQYVRRW